MNDLRLTELDEDQEFDSDEESDSDDDDEEAMSSASIVIHGSDHVRKRIPDLRREVSRVEAAIAANTLPPLAGSVTKPMGTKHAATCDRLMDMLKSDPLTQLGNEDLNELWHLRRHYMNHLVRKYCKVKPSGGFVSSNTANGRSLWSLLPSLFLAANYTAPSQLLEVSKVCAEHSLHACSFTLSACA